MTTPISSKHFRYSEFLQHIPQLARWLHKQLALKYTFASMTTPFKIRYCTIKRDSALLENYSLERKAVAALDAALDELKVQKVLLAVQKKEITGLRGKIEDVVYILTPFPDFVAQTKAANKRQSLAVETISDSVGNSDAVKTQ